MATPSINDTRNITNLTGLIDIGSDIDIDELERQIMHGNTNYEKEEADIIDEYKNSVNKMEADFRLAASALGRDTQSPGRSPDRFVSRIQRSPSPQQGRSRSISRGRSPRSRSKSRSIPRYTSPPRSYKPRDRHLQHMTDEEQRRHVIENALSGIERPSSIDINKEREEDDKISLLCKIDDLRSVLEDGGIDIRHIGKVSREDSLDDIQNIYRVLQFKVDRHRDRNFAEEVILACSYGLEYLMDGKREWFGRYPDLSGWSQTVKMKLPRIRHETTSLVQDIMQDYNRSPITRIAIELIPSAFLYSYDRKVNNTSNDNLFDQEYAEATNNLSNQFR